MKHYKTILVSILFIVSTNFLSASIQKTPQKNHSSLTQALFQVKSKSEKSKNIEKNIKNEVIRILTTTDPNLAETLRSQETIKDNNDFYVGSISKAVNESPISKIIEKSTHHNTSITEVFLKKANSFDNLSQQSLDSDNNSDSDNFLFNMDSDSDEIF